MESRVSCKEGAWKVMEGVEENYRQGLGPFLHVSILPQGWAAVKMNTKAEARLSVVCMV